MVYHNGLEWLASLAGWLEWPSLSSLNAARPLAPTLGLGASVQDSGLRSKPWTVAEKYPT